MKRKDLKYLMHLLQIHQEVCYAYIQRKRFTALNVRMCPFWLETGGVFSCFVLRESGIEFVSHCCIQDHSFTHGRMSVCVFVSSSVYWY